LQRRRAFLHTIALTILLHFFNKGFGGCNPPTIFTKCGTYIFSNAQIKPFTPVAQITWKSEF
ncbi:MAG: hypothetical protein KAQ79_19380, partial [Cyclobacteriaceae bacterium]|nr:hypothetical protein [Cyclobacteriaceae bacterium]